MAIPDEYTDLFAINQYIATLGISRNDTSKVMPGGWDLFPGIDYLERTYSSGNNFDCLIHSFFNATCPNFRLLNKEQKNIFADDYRRNIFINIILQSNYYNHQTKVSKKNIRNTTLNIEYLEDHHVIILCEYYRIKMVVFEVLVGERKMPSIVLYGERHGFNTDDDDVYMIYNPGQGHFEAVRTKNDKRYTLPLGFINSIREPYINPANFPNTKPSSVAIYNRDPSSVAYPNANENIQRAIKASLMPPAKGNLFSDDWICPVCYTDNIRGSQECVMCGTKKPGRGGRRTRKSRGRSSRGTRRRISHP